MKKLNIGITKKFIIGLIMIFTLGGGITVYFGNQTIEKNSQAIISKEFLHIKQISSVYIHQNLLLDHREEDEVYLKNISQELVKEIKKALNLEVSICNINGEILASTHHEEFEILYDDLKHAEKGKTAYTIKNNNDETLVYFSYPITFSNKQIGVVRILKDYSYLYISNQSIMNSILKITIAVFLISLIFVFVLSRSFIKPIIGLSHNSQQVAQGNFHMLESVERNDEIGILHKNFNNMVSTIKSQLETIKNDRDELKEVNQFRKQFYDNVTHELKTPLTTILGYSNLLKDKEYDKIFFDKAIKNISEESERLHKMVVDLLEYSKNGKIFEDEFEDIDISILLMKTIEEMNIKAKRYSMNIDVEIEENCFVKGVEEKLKEVFINIIDNAIKYGYEKTNISLATKVIDRSLLICIQNKAEYIPKDELEKLLTPYYQISTDIKGDRGSVGLGLSICKEIIEQHDGMIELVSNVDGKFSVNISLPLAKELKKACEKI